MKLTARENRRSLLVVFITLLIIFEGIVYVSITPRPQEQFFQLYLLGANHMASNYYPNNDSSIRPETPIRWYLGVVNSMGNAQLAVVYVKLANQTISPPDDLKLLPSPAPVVVELERFIGNNETWEIPFTWSLSKVTISQGSTRILELGINNQTYALQDWSAANGTNFRLIFELWTLNMQAGGVQYGWFSGTEHRAAWLQVWFNVTAPSSSGMNSSFAVF